MITAEAATKRQQDERPGSAHGGPRRSRHVVRAVLVAVGVVLLLLAAAWWLVLPAVVADRTRAALRDAGFAVAELDLAELSLRGVRFTGVRLAPAPDGGDGGAGGTFAVGSVRVRFSPVTLLRDGVVDEVVLDAPVWTLGDANALAPFDVLTRDAKGDDRGAATITRALPALPVHTIVVTDGRVVRADAAAPAPLATIAGTLQLDPASWRVSLDGTVGGEPVRVHGELANASAGASGSGGAAAAGPWSVQIGAEQPFALAGQLALDVAGGDRVATLQLQSGGGAFAVPLPGGAWTGEGTVAVRATVPFARREEAAVELTLDGVDLRSPQGFAVAGLAADLRATGLPVPVASTPQTVRWRSVEFGAFTTLAGSASLSLQPGPEFVLHEAQWAVDETGSMRLDGLRVAPGDPTFRTRVFLDDVPLEQWLQFATRGRVTGNGRISGSIGVVVTMRPQLDVDFGSGQVHASKAGGVVRFLEDETTEQLLRQHAAQIAAGTEHGPEVQDRIVSALQEFSYSELSFRLEPDAANAADGAGAAGKGVTLHVHAAGKGVRVPQELVLDVNFHGFDQAVDLALATKGGLDRARERLERRAAGPAGANPAEPAPGSPSKPPQRSGRR